MRVIQLEKQMTLTLEGIRGVGQYDPLPSQFKLNILFLDRLPKALAQLFFVS